MLKIAAEEQKRKEQEAKEAELKLQQELVNQQQNALKGEIDDLLANMEQEKQANKDSRGTSKKSKK